MRKLIFLFITLLAAFSAAADNYFTIDGAVNDTLLINPLFVEGGKVLTFRAHFDGRLDYWNLELTYPQGLGYGDQNAGGSNLYVPFVNCWGEDSVCHADFAMLQSGSVFLATITKNGYWDPDSDGVYQSYGTVKWEAGDYPAMFSVRFSIADTFHWGTLGIDGLLSSTSDSRGGTIGQGLIFHRNVVIHVGYRRGDVNGDGALSTSDVTAIINYTMSQQGLDDYQLEAADVNGDGSITISDVTELIKLILANGGTVDLNQFDFGTDF